MFHNNPRTKAWHVQTNIHNQNIHVLFSTEPKKNNKVTSKIFLHFLERYETRFFFNSNKTSNYAFSITTQV